MPGDHVVLAVGNIFDFVVPAGISLGKVGRRADNDVARHLRVNIAQQRYHAGVIELEGALLALGPGAKVVGKFLIAANGGPENIVLDGVAVQELDRCSHLNDQTCGLNTRPFWSMTGCCDGAGNVLPWMVST